MLVQSGRQDMIRPARSPRTRAYIGGASSTTPSAKWPNNTAASSSVLTHAPDDDDRHNIGNEVATPTPQSGAFNMMQSIHVMGEDGQDEDGGDMEFEEYENDVESVNSPAPPTRAQQQQEQRDRRTSSQSIGTILAWPVERPDEPLVQAQFVIVDSSRQPNLTGGRASNGAEDSLERRLKQKTNQLYIRFAILSVLIIVAAVVAVVVVIVVSNKNDPAPQPEGETPTNSPQGDFLAQLQSKSPTTSFENTTSPQSKARDWLFFSSNKTRLQTLDIDRLIQQFALATLFYVTSGETTWNQTYVAGFDDEDGVASDGGWLSTADISECRWPGLRCDGKDALIALDLSHFGLTGSLPPEVGLLTKLTAVIVSRNTNQISGTIPSQLGLLTELSRIDLASNKLKGTIPTELGRLVDLEYFGLGNNELLTGTIPTEIMLPKLTDLLLNHNYFSGAVPTEIGLVTALTGLHVQRNYNMFPNQLPTELGLLTALRIAYLDSMGCTGTIPSELGQLRRLVSLDLTKNRLTGTIFTELGHMTSLQELLLGDNLLYGPLPSEALARLTSLTSLDVAFLADVTGTIPTSLCHSSGGNLEKVQWDSTRLTFSCPIGDS